MTLWPLDADFLPGRSSANEISGRFITRRHVEVNSRPHAKTERDEACRQNTECAAKRGLGLPR